MDNYTQAEDLQAELLQILSKTKHKYDTGYDNFYGRFIDDEMQSLWEGFLIARRSQPSVVLPKGHLMDDPDGMGRGRYLMIESVERAITRAGYNYEVK